MCSYNQVNNSYACSNSYLLNYLLKNELDFQGFVMSDWGGQHAGVETTLAGLDMTMSVTLRTAVHDAKPFVQAW
jgi:beta-glucosidase-like glycosyl hydrolase